MARNSRIYGNDSSMIALQAQALKDQRERDDRAAVASGNVDENSALYRHAKLNGWDLGGKNELHGPARAKAVAAANSAPAAPRIAPRRPAGFGADDTGRMTTYFSDGSEQTVYNGTPQQQMFQQLGQIVERGKAERQRKRSLDDAALASCMVYAKQNGGFVPADMLNAVSAQLGQNLVGGNYTSDGNFVLYGNQDIRNANGQSIGSNIVPIAVADRNMQMSVLQRSGLGRSLQEELWNSMIGSGGLTPQQLKDRGIRNPYAAKLLAAQKAEDAEAKRQAKIDDALLLYEAKANRRATRNAARDAERRRLAAQNEEDRWVRQNYRRFQFDTHAATQKELANEELRKDSKGNVIDKEYTPQEAMQRARDTFRQTLGSPRRAEQFFEEPQAQGASPQAGAEGAGETPEPEDAMPTRGDSQHTFIDLSEVDDPNRRAQILIGAQPGSVAEVDGETRMLVGGQWVPAVNVNGRWAPIQ